MTALHDELEKMKAELAAQEGKEDEEVKLEEPEEEVHEEEAETKEEPKEKEIVEVKEEKLDDSGYARLRREAVAEKRRAEQAEKELAELRKVAEEVPEQITLPPQMQAIIERDNFNQAEKEFGIYESKVKQLYPEYGAVASEYAFAMYQSIRVQNPRKSEIELNEMTKKAILLKAGEFARAGYENPVEEMYHEARELGYTGKSFQKQEVKSTEEKLEPDMRKVAENRKRSAGMAATGGRQEGLMTLMAAADLTAGEWAKLSKADKKRLMYGQ